MISHETGPTSAPYLEVSPLPNHETDYDEEIFLPYSDNIRRITESEPFGQAIAKSNIQRLKYIKSLSNIAFTLPEGKSRLIFSDMNQDRYLHSVTVAITTEAIMRNNGFSEREIIEGVYAALKHDRGTPALGDATKSLDIDFLREEDYWDENMSEEELKFIEENGIDRNTVNAAIHDTGLLGEILDVADKISYVMIDLHHIGGNPMKNLGNIYKDVAVDRDSGQVYFKDPEKLGNFLNVRAGLFRDVYVGADSQASDLVFAKLLEPYYSRVPQAGKLTPQDLRQMTDYQLISFLADKYGVDPNSFHKRIDWFPQYRTSQTKERARAKARWIRKNPNLRLIGIKERQAFNPATDFKVYDETRDEIVPFRKAYPYFAGGIEQTAEQLSGYLIIYTSADDPDIARFLPEA